MQSATNPGNPVQATGKTPWNSPDGEDKRGKEVWRACLIKQKKTSPLGEVFSSYLR